MKENNQNTSHHYLRGIKNFFSQDLMWKLFSLVVAIFMWFIVMNIINPAEVKNFSASVSLENMEELTNRGYIVSNMEEIEKFTLNVRVEATRPALDELSKAENRSNIKGKIDLSKIEINDSDEFPKTYSVAIVPSLPSSLYIYNYDIANYYPTICEIEVDRSDTKTVPLSINTYGEPVAGYVAQTPQSSITEVEITGPESKIALAERVVATIDVTGAKANLSNYCEPLVYDEDNVLLEGFITSPEQIPVTVEIRKSGSVKIEEPVTLGKLPEYLELVSVDWSPKTIEVTSVGENSVQSITLPAINLSEITRNTTQTVDISDTLERANLKSAGNQTKVTITVKVELVDPTEYTINPENISITGLSSEYEATVDESVTFRAGGPEDNDLSRFNASVDLTGLGEGKHTVPVNIDLPNNIIVNEDLNVQVTISRKVPLTEETTAEAETAVVELTTSDEAEVTSNSIE